MLPPSVPSFASSATVRGPRRARLSATTCFEALAIQTERASRRGRGDARVPGRVVQEREPRRSGRRDRGSRPSTPSAHHLGLARADRVERVAGVALATIGSSRRVRAPTRPCSRSTRTHRSTPLRNGGSSRSSANACIVGAKVGASIESASSRSNVPLVHLEELRARRPRGRVALPRRRRRAAPISPNDVAPSERPEHARIAACSDRSPRPLPSRCERRRSPSARSPCRKTAWPGGNVRSRTRPARSDRTSAGRSSKTGSASISSAASTRHERLEPEPRSRVQRAWTRRTRSRDRARSAPRITGPTKRRARITRRMPERGPTSPQDRMSPPKICLPEEDAVPEREDREQRRRRCRTEPGRPPAR